MLSWLHCQILARKGAAEALPHGPWHIEGAYPQRISNGEAIVIAEAFEGPQFPPNIAQHIVAHDPRDTIARCEAELRIIALYEEEDRGRTPDYWDGLRFALDEIAHAYRHLPGWRPEWAPE
jgi:hypothetical protein